MFLPLFKFSNFSQFLLFLVWLNLFSFMFDFVLLTYFFLSMPLERIKWLFHFCRRHLLKECLFFNIVNGYLLLLELTQRLYHYLLLLLIQVVYYLLRLDDDVHLPLKVQVFIAPDWFIILNTHFVKLNQLHDYGRW